MRISFIPQLLKLPVLICALITVSLSLKAQDLIVTTSGDSTNCDILSVTETIMKLRCYNEATRNYYKTEIVMTEIADYKLNYYKENQGQSYYSNRGDDSTNDIIYSVPNIRLSASYGYSYKLGQSAAKTASEKKYEKEIRNGNRFGFTFDYYWNETSGLGFKFHRHRSDANLLVEVELDPTTSQIFSAREQLNISQYSILYRLRKYSWNSKNCFNLGVGLGYVAYRDEITILFPGSPQLLKEVANCAGLEVDVSYDIGISDNMAISIGGELSGGYFENSTLEFPDGSTEKVDYGDNGISAGRFGLWAAFVVWL